MPVHVIDDFTPEHVLFPRHFGRGFDLSGKTAAGYAGVADPFPEELKIPESEWQERIEEKVASKTQISDLCDQASLPCLNQEQTNYCWVNGPTYCTEVIRTIQGQAPVLLSPASVGGPITGFQNQGGWAKPALEYIAQNGIVPQSQWPANAISSQYHTDENVQLARGYRVMEWWDLNGPDVFENLVSCLLRGFPAAVGYNWWSHVVSAIEPVWKDGAVALRIRNSWGMTWGDRGYALIQGQKMVPDDAVSPRVVVAA